MKIAIFLDEANQSIDNAMQWNVMHQLGIELSEMHDILFLDSRKLGKIIARKKLLKQDYDALLLYNKTGTDLFDEKSNKSLLSFIDVPKISWLVEHPITFFDSYKKSTSKNSAYIFANPHHNFFSKKIGLNEISDSMLFGSSIKNDFSNYNSRKFDVCIAAQWRGEAKINEFWKSGTPFEQKFFETINTLQNLDDSGDVFTAFIAASEYYNVPLDDIDIFMPALKALYWHARKTERIKMVKDLVSTGLKILLVGGEGWKEVLPEYSNVTFVPACGHKELMEHYLNCRSVASVNCFNGANERTFDSMSCGAISIAENSPTLTKFFNDKNVIFYDRMRLNDKKDYLIDLLHNNQLSESMADSGFNAFKNGHTWKHRASKLSDFIFSINNSSESLRECNDISNIIINPMVEENRAIIFAHYDIDGKVHLDTIDLVKELVNYSAELIFVSTNISDDFFDVLSKYCKVIRRENYGYDFWSYKVGLDNISNRQKISNILFLNNSFVVTDPIKFCEEYFALKKNKDSLFGLTISNQISTHIQSYWIEFVGKNLINSKDFHEWWSKMIPISDATDVIINYEIGISQNFISKGYELNSLFVPNSNEKLIASMRSIVNYHYLLNEDFVKEELVSIDINLAKNLNPTSLLWYELLEKFHFVKIKTMKSSNHDFTEYLLKKYMCGLYEKSKNKCIDYLSDRKIFNQGDLNE